LKGIYGDSIVDGTVTLAEIPQSAKEGIDCLLCHAGIKADMPKFGTPGDAGVYKNQLEYDFTLRKTVKVADDDPMKAAYPTGFKMEQDRSVETARTVGGAPQFANCFYPCHGYSGGGYNNKKGARFEPAYDVHSAAGLDCVDCHEVKDHRFPGGITTDIFVSDDWTADISCSSCHTAAPHANRVIDSHIDKLDCTTCHITTLEDGIKTRDWTGDPKYKDSDGLYAPPTTKNTSETPNYLWWDRATHTAMPQLKQAEFRAAESGKIYAFKGSTFTVPVDEEHDQTIYAKAGKYFVSGDLVAAYTIGMADAVTRGLREGPWNGQWTAEVEAVNYQVTHMVKKDAWECNDCHTTEGSVLDWAALGYSSEEIAELTTPR
jgi:hypothetical protein